MKLLDQELFRLCIQIGLTLPHIAKLSLIFQLLNSINSIFVQNLSNTSTPLQLHWLFINLWMKAQIDIINLLLALTSLKVERPFDLVVVLRCFGSNAFHSILDFLLFLFLLFHFLTLSFLLMLYQFQLIAIELIHTPSSGKPKVLFCHKLRLESTLLKFFHFL